MKARFLISFCLLGFSICLMSGSPKKNEMAPAKVDPAKKYARQLSETMMSSEQYDEMLQAIVQGGVSMAADDLEINGGVPDVQGKGKDVETALRKKFTYEYFIGTNSTTIQKNFDAKEMAAILRFLGTDVGKKWLKHTPTIIGETMNNVQTDLQVMVPKLADLLKTPEVPKT